MAKASEITLVWTKSPFLVSVKVAGCSAPQLSVTPAFAGAGSVGLPQEDEGKLTRLTFRVSTNHCSVCEPKST